MVQGYARQQPGTAVSGGVGWFRRLLRAELVAISNTTYSCWAAPRVACALRMSTLLIHELLR